MIFQMWGKGAYLFGQQQLGPHSPYGVLTQDIGFSAASLPDKPLAKPTCTPLGGYQHNLRREGRLAAAAAAVDDSVETPGRRGTGTYAFSVGVYGVSL